MSNSIENSGARTSSTALTSGSATSNSVTTKATRAERKQQSQGVELKALASEAASLGTQGVGKSATAKGGEAYDKLIQKIVSLIESLVSILSGVVGDKKALPSGLETIKATTPTAAPSGSAAAATGAKRVAGTTTSPIQTTDSASGTPEKSTAQAGDSTRVKTQLARDTRQSCCCEDSGADGHTLSLKTTTDQEGAISVATPDGFTVRSEGKDQAWSILGPDGNETRIWGDPHVTESDGDTWQFKDKSSFKFGQNKVTVETVPAGEGVTVSSRITIYNGDERVTIDGVNTLSPQIVAAENDGKKHDAALDDGTIFDRAVNTRGESWSTKVGGRVDVLGH